MTRTVHPKTVGCSPRNRRGPSHAQGNGSAIRHVHFGAGRLGLGLAVPLLSQLDRQIVIVQRLSQPWSNLLGGRAKLIVNGNSVLEFEIIRSGQQNKSIASQLVGGGHILLLTDSPDDLSNELISQAASLSASLGQGLPAILPYLRAGKAKRRIPLLAFENDRQRVSRLAQQVATTCANVCVEHVVADKICFERIIGADTIEVLGEDAGEVTVFPNCPESRRLWKRPRYHPRVNVVHSEDALDFHYQKKVSLVNGLHLAWAFYAYAKLLEKGISADRWERQEINVVSYDDLKPFLRTLVKAQAMRLLLEYDRDILDSAFPDSPSFQQIYRELVQFGDDVIRRIHRLPDPLGRILDLRDPKNLGVKWEQRFQPVSTFVLEHRLEIRHFRETVDPTISRERMLDAVNRLLTYAFSVLCFKDTNGLPMR